MKEHLIFHNRFVSSAELVEFISAADIYLTPYPNEAQMWAEEAEEEAEMARLAAGPE